MRDRMIRKEFWSDDKIVRLSNNAKLLFIGIWKRNSFPSRCCRSCTYWNTS
ncbi:MAG: hypothetical protein ISS28_05245 [Candidatus Cloacimonetes bacterium]|nr:hypothetical protein [Candidatus Cloacimonadota bacterium]